MNPKATSLRKSITLTNPKPESSGEKGRHKLPKSGTRAVTALHSLDSKRVTRDAVNNFILLIFAT